MNATVSSDKIPVRHDIRPDVGQEYITFGIPNGWGDVKKVCKKVLEFDGRDFVFSCWNSDRMECTFVRLLNGPEATFAKIKRKK
jgi:hypothetical protein